MPDRDPLTTRAGMLRCRLPGKWYPYADERPANEGLHPRLEKLRGPPAARPSCGMVRTASWARTSLCLRANRHALGRQLGAKDMPLGEVTIEVVRAGLVVRRPVVDVAVPAPTVSAAFDEVIFDPGRPRVAPVHGLLARPQQNAGQVTRTLVEPCSHQPKPLDLLHALADGTRCVAGRGDDQALAVEADLRRSRHPTPSLPRERL
jgi:hypothetical protein